MPKIDAYEQEVLDTFEKGQLKSVTTKAELVRLKAAGHGTDGVTRHRWGQTRLVLNCSDRLSPPLAAGSTRLFSFP
ncbi:hypothetical protein NNRS527_02336 [Nitrosospira sp. NRS527]|nr:hypothetical protein NNRS527_02336 [Nitrosospira sp. NRS527]